jgi:hypothetical protein
MLPYSLVKSVCGHALTLVQFGYFHVSVPNYQC